MSSQIALILTPCDNCLRGKMEASFEATPPQPGDKPSLRTAASAIASLYERCKMVIETEGVRFEYKMK